MSFLRGDDTRMYSYERTGLRSVMFSQADSRILRAACASLSAKLIPMRFQWKIARVQGRNSQLPTSGDGIHVLPERSEQGYRPREPRVPVWCSASSHDHT